MKDTYLEGGWEFQKQLGSVPKRTRPNVDRFSTNLRQDGEFDYRDLLSPESRASLMEHESRKFQETAETFRPD